MYNDVIICKKCDSPRPPRTHHCSICNKCILKMDHHCRILYILIYIIVIINNWIYCILNMLKIRF